jgi:hypothetical protein
VIFIEVLDSEHMHRRFKISTFAMKIKIGPFGTHSPLNWIEGWNRLTLNLESFTKTVYGTNYLECRRITVSKNDEHRNKSFMSMSMNRFMLIAVFDVFSLLIV